LRNDGKFIVVGLPTTTIPVPVIPLVFGGKQVIGSIVGGSLFINEMLHFCAVHKIYPLVETFEFKDINTALKKLVDNKVRYRVVLKW
jgi:uncharacterized zinc-type alcohol dehydrogenase-like protein